MGVDLRGEAEQAGGASANASRPLEDREGSEAKLSEIRALNPQLTRDLLWNSPPHLLTTHRLTTHLPLPPTSPPTFPLPTPHSALRTPLLPPNFPSSLRAPLSQPTPFGASGGGGGG